MGTGPLLALTAVQAISSIGQGYVQQEEAKYNAQVYESQAELTRMKSDIEQGQYQRAKARSLSKSMVSVAGMGIQPTGSALAAILDAQTQMNIDQAIAKFNARGEENYSKSQAEEYRIKGKQARYSGYSDAFGILLKGGYQYGKAKGWIKY